MTTERDEITQHVGHTLHSPSDTLAGNGLTYTRHQHQAHKDESMMSVILRCTYRPEVGPQKLTFIIDSGTHGNTHLFWSGVGIRMLTYIMY